MSSVWPYADPQDRPVFTTRFVLDKGLPILIVSHDPDGEWEFLCGTTDKPKDARELSLGEVVDLDPSVAQVADLPPGWRALRDSPEGPWIQEPFLPEELAKYRA